MFEYTVFKEADNIKFKEACNKIENSIHDLIADKLLIDVDGSLIQRYSSPGGDIKVYNDYEIDAVYIDSEIDLKHIF